jgi:hypothetical protein
MVAYLASPEAGFVTGASLTIDGGIVFGVGEEGRDFPPGPFVQRVPTGWVRTSCRCRLVPRSARPGP